MKLVQDKRRNYLVNPNVPWTWECRIRQYKVALPLLVFSVLLLFETIVVRSWLEGWFSWGEVMERLAIVVGAIVVAYEIIGQTSARSKRRLEWGEKGVIITPAVNKANLMRWKWIRRWSFTPVADKPGTTRLTLTLEIGKQSRSWAIVLENSTEKEAFLAFLKAKTAASEGEKPEWQIEVLTEPAPAMNRAKLGFRGLWMVALSFYLLTHGMLLAFTGFGDNQKSTSGNHDIDAAKIGQVRSFLYQHFDSRAEFVRTARTTGVALCIAGAGFYVIGFRNIKPRVQNQTHGRS